MATLASSQSFLLEGEVTHPFEKELDNIHIFNTNTFKGTVTDINGRYTISVSIGDTLSISALQYEKVSIAISLEHYVTKKLSIELTDITNELDEIFLRNHNLTGDLDKDSKSIKTNAPVSPFSLGIVKKEVRVLTQSERQLKTASYGAGAMSLDGIINAISGRTKMLKKRVEVDKTNVRIENLLAKFPLPYLVEELKIEEDAIYDFLYYCEADPDFLETIRKDRITILHFLREKAVAYLKLQGDE
tara:strand:+ start:185837 stop:186571 length:735 start_codon:yes stop_codon:yes gene_type:complete